MTCPSEHLLVATALGELSPNEAPTIGEHLATCDKCAALTRKQGELVSLLRTDAVPAASDAQFVQRVMVQCIASSSVVASIPLHR